MRRFVLLVNLLGILLVGFSAASLPLKQVAPLYWTGSVAIKNGDYQKALEEVLSDSVVTDTIHRYFKLGYIHQQLKNSAKAAFLFKYVAQNCSILAPVAYEHIALIELENQNLQNVIASYKMALQYKMPQSLREYFYNQIYSLCISDTLSTLKTADLPKEYQEWFNKTKKPDTKSPVASNPALDLVKKGEWKLLDSSFDSFQARGNLDCPFIRAVAESSWVASLKAKNIFSLAQQAYSCRMYKTANSFIDHLKKHKDLATVSESKLLYLSAQIDYERGKFAYAIEQFKKYEKKFGYSSELLMYVARAYRKLGNISEAGKWYDKHIKVYPSHPKTQEIMWYRAWTREDQKDYRGAARYYKDIYTKYTKGDRNEESYLRHALTYYRMEKYDSALIILNLHKKKYPVSNFANAVSYWKAKSLFYLSRIQEAQELLRQISRTEPYDYYAYRARELLGVTGDSCKYVIDTVFDVSKTLQWLDSIVPATAQKNLSKSDSLDFYCGRVLISAGLVQKASFYLENLEKNYPANLKLQFELAMMYSVFEAPAEGFRIARRFSWRIPLESRSKLPLGMYTLLYPAFFMDSIKSHARAMDIDPLLVISVIRQESIFNPRIVSPVGAVGLMQIMPYTGEHIAKGMGESFLLDSLYQPFFNIRYGTWYLRELLQQFNENLVLAIASYNGGPHNVKTWYERNKDEEFDLFIEDLAYSETRTYVKKVLANYWTYQLLSNNKNYSGSFIYSVSER
ncbi:MAG: transglycosylase SLT domain-containing protein [Fibrobacter sp.]|nr:transglycosylase SLT domain-containing protein [Fibrobacter sp.]